MKLNKIMYKKLLAQAEEAKEQGFEKLAGGVLTALGPAYREEEVKYSEKSLKEAIYKSLWNDALLVLAYHDLQSADIQKLDETVKYLTEKVSQELESTLELNDKVSDLEPKLPGQK